MHPRTLSQSPLQSRPQELPQGNRGFLQSLSLQAQISRHICNPLDLHRLLSSFLLWRSFTVTGTKVASFPILMWGGDGFHCLRTFSFSLEEMFTSPVWYGPAFDNNLTMETCGCRVQGQRKILFPHNTLFINRPIAFASSTGILCSGAYNRGTSRDDVEQG